MRLGDISNADATRFGKPLAGVRVLALEQMQALPWATQLLARLGADVIKVESPTGDLARSARPGVPDPFGRNVGSTFLRNNLNKRSIVVNLKHPRGRDLLLDLIGHFDVMAESFRGGALAELGLGYPEVMARHPRCIYLSVSGFGNSNSPYTSWPAYAPIVEAMTGIYDYKQPGDHPPLVAPMGGIGDIGTGLFSVIGVLAALRHRDATGLGQHVDVALLDSLVAMTDIVTNFWSLGMERGDVGASIMNAFRAADGWFVIYVGREAAFELLARLIGREDWLQDEQMRRRESWAEQLEPVIRPGIEDWARTRTRAQACAELSAAGIPAGPSFTASEVVADPHIAARQMLVEMPRGDGLKEPVLVPGNPVKLSRVAEGPEARIPWLGEHTRDVLGTELGLSETALDELARDGVIA